MTSQQISKVWTVVSLALLYYALNSYLVMQGGHEIFGAKLVTEHRVPAALVAVAICSVLLGLASAIGIDFARDGGQRWADRVPLVALNKLDSSKLSAQLYQAFMLFALSLLPAIWAFGIADRAIPRREQGGATILLRRHPAGDEDVDDERIYPGGARMPRDTLRRSKNSNHTDVIAGHAANRGVERKSVEGGALQPHNCRPTTSCQKSNLSLS